MFLISIAYFTQLILLKNLLYSFKVENALEEVIVTEVSPDLQFFVQKKKDSGKLCHIMEQVSNYIKGVSNSSSSFKPKRGDICASK